MDSKDKEDQEIPQTYDMSAPQPIAHRHDKIIGNELRCSLHEPNTVCPVIFVKPTEILIKDEEGILHLYDNAKEPTIH